MLLYFEMELSSPKPEKVLIFSPKNFVVYQHGTSSPKPEKQNKTKKTI